MAPKRILVVDDEEGLRMTLAANLELFGYEVLEAEDAAQALTLLAAHEVDLVLSDVRMPGMSGIDLQRRLRQERPDVPVVLMTAYTDEARLEEAVLGGVFTVLSKPFEIDAAASLLERAIRRPPVIIVDDPEADARTIADSLREAGLAAAWVRTGAEAVEAVRAGNVDVCLVALELGDEDGVAVIREIRAADPSVILIALSARDAGGSMQAAAAHRIHRFLQKPVDLRHVLQAIAAGRGGNLAGS